MTKELSIETLCVHGKTNFEERTGAISYPIYQCATFAHPGLHETTGYDYSRQQNPTREELEKSLARLENGKYGMAFTTGMSAITAVFSIFAPGDKIISTDDLYGGTYRLFEEILKRWGLTFDYFNPEERNLTEKLEQLIDSRTKAIFVETISNPMMKITDIPEIARIAKKHNILLIVDNTFLSPYFHRPLDFGADIVLHSGTKYIGGHNDTLAGLVALNSDELYDKIFLYQKSTGAVLSAFDSWLILRGLKTLSVRFERAQDNAIKIAEWLKTSKTVESVLYAKFSLNSEKLSTFSKGFGAMISFTVKDVEKVKDILKNVKLISFAESLGGVETLITYPLVQTHASIPEELREKLGITDRLLRLSVGIENVEDLIEDLKQAFGE